MVLENIFKAQTGYEKAQKLECSVLQSHVIPHCHVIRGCSRQGVKASVSDQMEHKIFFFLCYILLFPCNIAQLFIGNSAALSLFLGGT